MPRRTKREYRGKNNVNPPLSKAMSAADRMNEKEANNLVITVCLAEC